MKETKIEIPAGCEVEKIETQDGHVAVVTFREKERKLPKTWEEFCEMFPIKRDEKYIFGDSTINSAFGHKRYSETDKNVFPDRATAEAVLDLCQLIQLRDCYNGDWVPDWDDGDEAKYTIEFRRGKLDTGMALKLSCSPLYFKSAELRDEFLRNFRDLIEKLKPLYGIKENDNQ